MLVGEYGPYGPARRAMPWAAGRQVWGPPFLERRQEEWRSRWCWIVEEDPQEFCRVRQAPPVHRVGWSNVDADDEKLTVATTRIHRLTMAGLTLEMIGADFIRR